MLRGFRTTPFAYKEFLEDLNIKEFSDDMDGGLQDVVFVTSEYGLGAGDVVRKCWKALAKHPVSYTKAQERILAETEHSRDSGRDHKENQHHGNNNQPMIACKQPKAQNREFRIASFNVRGMNFISARQHITYVMKEHNVNIAALFETRINYTGKETHADYCFYFSSNIDDDMRKRTEKELEDYTRKVKQESIPPEEAQRERMKMRQKAEEKLGCAIVYNTRLNYTSHG